MKFLALECEKPGLTAQDFAPYGKTEARRAWELYAEGVFREMYFNPEDHTAVIILEAVDKDAAQTALDGSALDGGGWLKVRFEEGRGKRRGRR